MLDVHFSDHDQLCKQSTLTKILEPFDAEIAHTHIGEYNGLAWRREKTLSQYCTDKDWVLIGDLDEFAEFDEDINTVTKYCEQNGYDYVHGELVDRISLDGRLAQMDASPIWQQFPLSADLTGVICAADKRKVPLIRPFVKLVEGQHQAINGRGCPREEIMIPVHHFKWDETVIERCHSMLNTWIFPGQNVDDWRHQERNRFLKFASENFIDLNDSRLKPYVVDFHLDTVAAQISKETGFPVLDTRLNWSTFLQKRAVMNSVEIREKDTDELYDLYDDMDGSYTIQQQVVILTEKNNISYAKAEKKLYSALQILETQCAVSYRMHQETSQTT